MQPQDSNRKQDRGLWKSTPVTQEDSGKVELRRPSVRQHRRSASDASSRSDATSAMIGVTLDPTAWDDAADDRDLSAVFSPSREMSRRLIKAHRSLRDAVLLSRHPPEERAKLVSMVVNWAAQLMLDPLAEVKEVKEDATDEDGCEAPMLAGAFDDHAAPQEAAGYPV
jgi:hypothetical protein